MCRGIRERIFSFHFKWILFIYGHNLKLIGVCNGIYHVTLFKKCANIDIMYIVRFINFKSCLSNKYFDNI